MQRLEHFLPFLKTQGRENIRRGESVEDPETRLSMDLCHDIEQLLET